MSTVKRRRFKRYKLKLAATLVTDNSSFIHCMIRDCCSGGLLVEPLESTESKFLKPQQKIQVLFSVGLGKGSENYNLNAIIMHIQDKGIGIAFEKNSDAAFKALKREAINSLSIKSAKPQREQNSLSKQKTLEVDLSSLLQETLPIFIHSFYQHSEAKLKQALERVENYEYITSIKDAITNLKLNKDVLFTNFCAVNIEPNFQLLSPSGQVETTDTETSLSLIEKNDFEDWLNLSAIIRKLESVYKSQLQQLQRKMAFIVGVDASNIINPASPAILCDRFRDTLTEIENNYRVKDILYTVYKDTLLEFLPDLYDNIETILHSYGAPKKITDTSNWKNIKKKTEIVDHLKQQVVQTNTVLTHQPASATTSGNTLLSAQPVISAHESRSVVSVASNLLQLVQGHIYSQKNNATSKTTSSSEYTQEEINKALVHLQQNVANMNTLGKAPHALQNELLNALKTVSKNNKELSSSNKNNLEVHESLFEILFNDHLLSEEIQTYLKRLYLPIMKQAFQDPGFLESENNPARNIVNHLSSLEMAIKENKSVKNTPIKETIEILTDKIDQEALHNPAIFSTVEQQFNDLSTSINKSVENNIKRVTEVYDGKQKLDKARLAAQEEISKRLSGKKVPKIIATLLEAGWQHLFVISKLNDDDQAFQSYLRIIINLIAWLTGPDAASEEQVDTKLEFIDTQLQSVCTNTFLHNKILCELKTLLLGNNIQGASNAMDLITIDKDEISQIIGKAKRRADETDQLKVGHWLSFLLENKKKPLKLVWINDSQDLFVFVNRSGNKELELNGEDLAEFFRRGTAKRIESLDLPLMDRATDLMLQKMHEKVLHNGTRDPVTNLLNRKEFTKQLKQELLKFDNDQNFLCNIEIHDFRIITNACGLTGGDALLKQLAEILIEQLNKEDPLARLDDKTFSILLKDCSTEEVDKVAKILQTKLTKNDFNWQDKSYAIAVNIGLVHLLPATIEDVNRVMQKADTATLSATNAGRNNICVYKDDDESLKSQKNIHEWAGHINKVFTEDRLFLRCQKIAAINPEKSTHNHYEILLGIKDENDKVLPPDKFIPAVERCQRMSEIDRWVVRNVFDWIEQHEFDFEMLDGFSINLSGESIQSQDFLDFLKHTLTSSNIPLEKIIFEITETVAAGSLLFVQNFIKQIKHFNCKFSLDDFGSGYSSYAYLKCLDVDFLKIDGAFVKDMLDNETDIAIVKSMNEIAHSLELETIAEYVENDGIHALLKDIGVDYAQGWGIQKPILLTDLA